MRRRSPASELSGLERAGNAVSGRAEFTPPRGRAPRLLLCSLAPSLGDAETLHSRPKEGEKGRKG